MVKCSSDYFNPSSRIFDAHIMSLNSHVVSLVWAKNIQANQNYHEVGFGPRGSVEVFHIKGPFYYKNFNLFYHSIFPDSTLDFHHFLK